MKMIVATLKTTTDNTEIDVYVGYQDGKSGRNNWKGYTLHVQPVHRELDGQYVIKTMKGWSGMRASLEETKRFSEKRMGELAAKAADSELYLRMLTEVLETNNITLA